MLRPREHRMLSGIARAAMPPGDVLDVGVDDADLHGWIDAYVAQLPAVQVAALHSVFGMFELSSVPRYGRPYSALSADRQAAWLESWVTSRIGSRRLIGRLLLTLVKPAHIRRRVIQERLGVPIDYLKGLDDAAPTEPLELSAGQMIRVDGATELRCQVVVVGSGAGGAVAARELASRGLDVVIVEEGGRYLREPGRYDAADNLPRYYRDAGGTIALGLPPIPVPLGMGVGGSTTFNSGTCMRTPERIFDRWRRAALPVDDLDGLYDEVEERIGAIDVPEHLLGGSSHVVRRGAEALGLAHGPLQRNIRGCRRSAVCVFGCPTGAKQAADVTWVPDALELGARMAIGARVTDVIVRNGRAVGVRAGPLTVHADAVVLACGTVHTPDLLRGVSTSPHLGRHFTMHPASKIIADMPEVVDGWEDTPQGYGVHGLHDQGILMEGAFVPPAYAAIAFPFAGRAFTAVMERYRHLAMFGMMIEDTAEGQVLPGAQMTYNIGRAGLARVSKGLEALAEIFFAAGAERLFLPVAGREEQSDMDGVRSVLRGNLDPLAIELVGFHPLGTARMASRARDGLVDPDLQSWEVPGLYVMDGSVVPTALAVNPQLTIMALAMRGARRLRV